MRVYNKISLALLTGMLSTSVMADPLTVYGKANISAQSSDEGEGSFTELKSNASRFGVKGDMDLDNDLSVFYTFEWQVDLADLSGSDNIKSRNQYLGLKGNFGTVKLGRNDSILKSLSKPVDMFNDYEADLKGLWKGENRVSDSVTYESPTLNGFGFGMTYAAEDEVDGTNGVSLGVYYGDKKLKKSKLFAALTMDSDIKGYDVQRAIVQTKLGDFTVGAILHKQEATDSNDSKSGATVSTQYQINKWKLKAQYQTLEDDNSFSFGADYKLGKQTKAYAWFTDRGIEDGKDKSWLAVGLEHKF